MDAKETLTLIIKVLNFYLSELNALPRNDFIHGEMTAYVEILEIIQKWKDHKEYDLDYVIENRYKI